jgi:hypothetical protein
MFIDTAHRAAPALRQEGYVIDTEHRAAPALHREGYFLPDYVLSDPIIIRYTLGSWVIE